MRFGELLLLVAERLREFVDLAVLGFDVGLGGGTGRTGSRDWMVRAPNTSLAASPLRSTVSVALDSLFAGLLECLNRLFESLDDRLVLVGDRGCLGDGLDLLLQLGDGLVDRIARDRGRLSVELEVEYDLSRSALAATATTSARGRSRLMASVTTFIWSDPSFTSSSMMTIRASFFSSES